MGKVVKKNTTKSRRTKASASSAQESLAHEITAIRQSLDLLRAGLGIDGFSRAGQASQKQLGVFISRGSTPAKPFIVQCQGVLTSTFKLSTIRAVIFIVLIVDLEDRLEGGRGVDDPLSAIVNIVRLLEPDNAEADSPDRIRVAVYRFWEFCQSTDHLKGSELELVFDDKRIKLDARKPDSSSPIDSLKIEVTSNDHSISSILAETLTRSPIEQVRKRKALFVPAGPEGADRLLLEMYDHPHPLTVTSLYLRPPLPSYPDALLEKMAVSPRVRRRKALAFEGYQTGRVQFFEVLHEGTIWDLIRRSENDGFKLYPRNITEQDIASHIANLIDILNHYEQYHLYITKMIIPFVVVTYDIRSHVPSEAFTVFFQSSGSASQRDLGCFALYDHAVYQSISKHIVQWLVSHPSTLRDRGDVVGLLQRVLSYLGQHGPLSLEAPIPEGF